MRRGVAVGATVAVAVAAAGGGWLAGRGIKSPEQAALEAEPPPASLITVEVELAELTADVITRADVGYDEPVTLSLSGAIGDRESVLAVTAAPERGAELAEGSVAIEIAGRPVFVLAGTVPVYRDLRPLDSGPDVEQLEQALARLGHFNGKPDPLWDGATGAAVNAWYEAAGYDANGVSHAEQASLRTAHDRVDDARDALAAAERALAGVLEGPDEIAVRRARTEWVAAQSALTRARLDAERAVTDAELALADAELAVVDADLSHADAVRAVTEAERTVDDAVRAVTEAERTVDDAVRAVTEAERTVDDAVRAVTEAERTVSDAVRAVTEAERTVDDAVRAVTEAERTVSDAVRAVTEAERTVDDAEWAVVGARSAREQAAHGYNQAQLRWESARAGVHPDSGHVPTPAQHEALRLALAAAERSLADAERAIDAAKRNVADAERAVDAARRAVDEAELGVEAARRAVDEAHLGVDTARRAVDEAELGVEAARRAVDEAHLGVDTARRAVDEAELGVEAARRAVDEAELGVEAARRAVSRAETEAARRRAAVPSSDEQEVTVAQARLAVRSAGDSVAAAEQSLAELLEPPDSADAELQVESARQELADAEQGLADLAEATGVWLPAGELIVLGRLPVRVDLLTAERGTVVSGAFMTVTGSELAVRGSVSERDVDRVSEGIEARIDDRTLEAPIVGKVRLVDRRAGSRGVASDRHYMEIVAEDVPEHLVGTNVKIVIPVGGTDGAVLVVPAAALSATADGSTRVEVEQPDGTTRFVTVEPGLSTGGRVEVTPIGGELREGDRVVVGVAAGA